MAERRMRILCLHGKGTSGRIFKSQTASLRSKLEAVIPELEYDFVDGPQPSSPAPDTPLFYEPPHYAFYEGTEIKAIRAGHKWLRELLEHNGPYDGVLMFSQGCALVSSYMLYQQWYEPEAPPPFQFAMFICGGVPITALKDLGVHVSQEVEDLDVRTKKQLLEKTTAEVTRDRWQLTDYASVVRRAQFDSDDCFGLNLNRIPAELKIRIPTVHVFGEKDPRLPASIQLAGLCDPYIRKVYNHGGGHEIPRAKEVSEELAQLLQWCAIRGTWPGQGTIRH
ncbi:Serine hydrolase FSH [Apiospora arundinis]|uniref:Serine hydrolase FSH n=1 Tax=Apiospora arundinis TaxID=335852 RepID=A0ABR2IVG2_9PEZI